MCGPVWEARLAQRWAVRGSPPTHPPIPPPHPTQGEDPDYKWTLTVMGFWLKLFLGLVGIAISVTWLLQIILYILISPPVSPLLNTLFTK